MEIIQKFNISLNNLNINNIINNISSINNITNINIYNDHNKIYLISQISIITISLSYIFGYMFTGPVHSPLSLYFGKSNYIIKGYVSKGYEEVKEVFEKIIKDGMEEQVQVCAFVDGKVVVNLIGIANSKKQNHPESQLPYSPNSIQNIFSSTKAISSVVIAMLVDRGYLRYDMPISDIWPEFSQLEKHIITLEDLMKHESGMDKFSFVILANQLHRDSIKSGVVGKMIAETTSSRVKHKEPERSYHFLTRDIILNEIVRRADPKGRTIGEFVRDEIATPLEIQNQLTIGPETLQQSDNLFPLVRKKPLWILFQLFNFISRKVSTISCIAHLVLMHSDSIASFIKLFMNIPKPSIVLGQGESEYLYLDDMFNNPIIRQAEVPSANGHASAYALAKVASVMSAKGSQHGVKLISNETYNISTGNVTEKYDKAVNFKTKFCTGGWCIFDSPFAFGLYRHGSIGWFGIGGSAIQWHDDLNIGYGYTPTLVGAELGNKNSALVQDSLIKCVKKIKSSS